jgi:hypothetical protein
MLVFRWWSDRLALSQDEDGMGFHRASFSW